MGKRMTVLQVLPALQSGGVERGVLEVAEALVDHGHRSLVVSAGGGMVDELVSRGSEHFCCPLGVKSPLTLRHVHWMRRFLQREPIDIVDIHSRLPGWITWMAWKSLPARTRPRLISTLHGLHSVSRYSSIMSCGELVIVVSETVRDYVLKNYPAVRPEHIRLVHRGIDDAEYPRGYQPSEEWKQSFYTEFPQLAGQPVVTLAGRITRLKGHHDLLKVLANLRDAGSPVHGLIVGGAAPGKSAYLEEVRRQVTQYGLDDLVSFAGQRNDLREIYSVSDVVVSMSQTPESFGRTVAEALSIGTPAVAWDHGGVSEILAAQFPQGAIRTGDIEAFSDRIRSILAEPDAFPVLPNRFTRSDMLTGTLSVYEEILDDQRLAA